MKVVSQILSLAIVFILGCSAPTSVAGGSDNPDFAIGIAMTSDGKPAVGARIECASSTYNPINGSSGNLVVATTDSKGRYALQLPGKGNITITIYEPTSCERAIGGTINTTTSDTIVVDTLKTSAPASITLLVADTIAHSGGYIEGTSIKFGEATKPSTVPGYNEITIDSIPAGKVPVINLIVPKEESPVQVVGSFSIVSGSSTELVAQPQSSSAKPVWKIRMAVGIRSALYDAQNVDSMVRAQIQRINDSLQDTRLNGTLLFAIDTLFAFTGTSADLTVPIPNKELTLIVTDEFTNDFAEFSMKKLSILHTPTGATRSSLFTPQGDYSLVRALMLSRGCFDRYGATVDSAKNPLTNRNYGYSSNYATLAKGFILTDYDIFFLNRAAKHPSYVESVLVGNSPDTLGFSVMKNGVPVVGWKVELYGVPYGLRSVNSAITFSGVTNSNGEYHIGSRPFSYGVVYPLQYGAFVCRFSKDAEEFWQWVSFEAFGEYGVRTATTIVGTKQLYPIYLP